MPRRPHKVYAFAGFRCIILGMHQNESSDPERESPAARWLRSHGISQRALAFCVGESQATISRRISGTSEFTRDLEIALRTVIATSGVPRGEIESEMAALRKTFEQKENTLT